MPNSLFALHGASAQPGLLRICRGPAANSSFRIPCKSTGRTARCWPDLERAKACLAGGQWDEAVETLRQVMESSEGKLLEVAPGHFVNFSDACQQKLAAAAAGGSQTLSPPRRSGREKMVRRRVWPAAMRSC